MCQTGRIHKAVEDQENLFNRMTLVMSNRVRPIYSQNDQKDQTNLLHKMIIDERSRIHNLHICVVDYVCEVLEVLVVPACSGRRTRIRLVLSLSYNIQCTVQCSALIEVRRFCRDIWTIMVNCYCYSWVMVRPKL